MNKIWVYLILWGLVACNMDRSKTVDREKIKQEMEDRQIKRVSEPQLMEAAFETGAKLAGTVESLMIKRLNKLIDTMQTDTINPEEETVYPPINAIIGPVLDSLNRTSNHFVSLIIREPEGLHADTLAIEKQLLEAYQYNVENMIPSEDNVQKSGTDHLLFTRPIISKTGKCMTAFMENQPGSVVDSLQEQAAYFCGMWSIRLSKKEIVKSL